MSAEKWEKTKTPGVYRFRSKYVVKWRDERGRARSASFRTMEEARRAKARRVAGDMTSPSREPFGPYALAWVERYQGRTAAGLTEDTRGQYRDALLRQAVPFFGRTRLDRIGPTDVREFILGMQDAGLSSSSVRKYLAPVKAMLAEAVEDGTLSTNPAREVRVIGRASDPYKEVAHRMLSPDEIRALRENVPEAERDLFDFLAFTGVRISEALGATWQRVTQDESGRPVFEVREQFYGGKLHARAKTRAGRRAVPLTPEMTRRLMTRRATSPWGAETDPVFPTRDGTHRSAHNFRARVFRPAATRVGVPWATPHTLRHSLASLLLAHGHTVEQIAAWLGHADSSFTLRTYVHTRDAGSADGLHKLLG